MRLSKWFRFSRSKPKARTLTPKGEAVSSRERILTIQAKLGGEDVSLSFPVALGHQERVPQHDLSSPLVQITSSPAGTSSERTRPMDRSVAQVSQVVDQDADRPPLPRSPPDTPRTSSLTLPASLPAPQQSLNSDKRRIDPSSPPRQISNSYDTDAPASPIQHVAVPAGSRHNLISESASSFDSLAAHPESDDLDLETSTPLRQTALQSSSPTSLNVNDGLPSAAAGRQSRIQSTPMYDNANDMRRFLVTDLDFGSLNDAWRRGLRAARVESSA